MKPLGRAFLSLFLLAGLSALPAQVAKEANKQYQTPEGRAAVAKNLDDPHRSDQLKPKELVALIGIKPGSTVADIGTGVGYMLPFLSAAAGPSGRILAEDIAADFVEKAQALIQADKLTNVTTVLGNEKDPNLPAGAVDVAFTLEVYHHFNYPGEMLANIAKSLKPNGRLVVADFYKIRRKPTDRDMSQHIRLDRDDVIKEVEQNGFRLVSKHDHGSSFYVLLFEKK